MKLVVYLLLISTILTSCQTLKWQRPDVPACISNGDGSAECADRNGPYSHADTTNWLTLDPDNYKLYEDYVGDLERRLSSACVRYPNYCSGL